MNWTERAAWIYKDASPDTGKAAAHGIRTVYIDPRSSNAKTVVQQLRAAGLNAGIYVVSSWTPGITPANFVAQVKRFTTALIPQAYPLDTQAQGAPVMLDLEDVNSGWVQSMLQMYRVSLPSRESAYTNMPFQDGTVVPVDALENAGFHWYPQLYYGDMGPADPAAVLLEVCRWGMSADRVHPFYDGARVPADARDGCVFTLERMP